MTSITTDLPKLLSTVQRPGDFYATGVVEIFAPQLEVDGVGPIAFPLLAVQAKQLIAVAERAPYGRGEQTLVDTDVRRTWQIGASRVRMGGRKWAESLDSIVARAAAGLGVTGGVSAEFYKLLVYDEGSFFQSHRDTEKTAGMFATLVVVLPSICMGGELLVRHKGREVRLDLSCREPSDASFAAFYADCVHEVLPVTSGCRLTLVYNLVRKSGGELPKPPSYEAEEGQVVARLGEWVKAKASPEDDSPEKLVYPLEHAYTAAELSFARLKGADAAMSALLTAAAPRADCDLHLALLSIDESGAAEENYYGSRGRRNSDAEYEVVEVTERSATLSDWQRPDGNASDLGVFPFEDEELCPPDANEGMEPDEDHFHEATGNEGASFERTYRRAALVLWPTRRRLAVLSQAGLAVTLPYLGEIARRWASSGESQASPLWREAHELSGHMMRGWPMRARSRWHEDRETNAATLLTVLRQLNDAQRIAAFVSDVSAASGFGKGDCEALLTAIDVLSWERAADLIACVVRGNAAEELDACSALLLRAALRAQTPEQNAALAPAATALLERLPGDPARAPAPENSWRVRSCGPEGIADLLTALVKIDPERAVVAAEYILAWPKTYDFDGILIPALARLAGGSTAWKAQAVVRLRSACAEHLGSRIAEPLAPPGDWTRPATLCCTCPSCAQVSRFLADPSTKVWSLKAAQYARNHVYNTIRSSSVDLDLTTERKGSPHALVCTKNQASYEKRAQQRALDLENLAQLDAARG